MSPDHVFLPSPRRVGYEKAIDCVWQSKETMRVFKGAVNKPSSSYGSMGTIYLRELFSSDSASKPHNLISSRCEDGLHRPCLDIDHETVNKQAIAEHIVNSKGEQINPELIIALPSVNHWHVYIPFVAYSWPEYVSLLEVLASEPVGVLEPAYVSNSVYNGATFLRASHTPKFNQNCFSKKQREAYQDKLAEGSKKLMVDYQKILDELNEDELNKSVLNKSVLDEPVLDETE